MPLNSTQVKNARPGAKNTKLTDGRGLYLLVTAKGGKLWRFDYRFAGKRKTLALGLYPDVGLKLARERREEVRQLLAREVCPAAVHKQQKHTLPGVLRRFCTAGRATAR